MNKVQRKLFIPIVAILLFAMSCITASASSKTWTSTANGNSEKVNYTLSVTPVRTGETTAKINYKLLASWPYGGEGHGQPTKITATIYCDGQERSFVVKNRGSNRFNKVEGSFKVNVGAKQTTKWVGVRALGSGSYQTSRKVSYTYYTTSYDCYYMEANPDGSYRSNYRGSYSSPCPYSHRHNAVGWSYLQDVAVSTRHSYSKTVWDTHSTNSGTLPYQKNEFGTMQQWFYVSYDAVGGSPTPATHGFIGGKSTKISKTVPKYWCKDIQKYGYTNTGWSTTKYALNTGTATYKGGAKYSKKADLKLYAVYKANKVARIVFNANGGNKNSVPSPIDKYYNINVNLPTKIPTYPATENKGVRHYFLRWNTKPDGTGTNFNAGAVFNLNANPHEKLPQDVINLYAIWYVGTDVVGSSNEKPVEGATPGIRYIEKDSTNTLGEDSKWRSGVRQQQLEDSLSKEGSGQAKSTYDADGNKIK